MEPHSDLAAAPLDQPHPALTVEPVPGDPVEQVEANEQVSIHEISRAQAWWDETGVEVVRATRSWIQYGTLAFAVICIVIGAVEALAGR